MRAAAPRVSEALEAEHENRTKGTERKADRPLPPPRGKCYRPPPMPRSPLTKKELGEFRKRLEDERQELSAQFTDIEESSFGTPQSELSGEVSFDEEYADSGTATFERERDLSLTNNIRDLLDKIDRALARMEDGMYGVCERCGRPIEKARLKALPYANLCIKDKTAEERARGR
jgi:DnaK suppressor protein